MKIFSKHRRKLEPKRRFGGLDFRNKVREAANYKRAFNPTSKFSLNIGTSSRAGQIFKISSIALVLLVGYLMFSSSHAITEITVKGNKQISSDQIREVLNESTNSRLLMVKKNNFFLMSGGRVNKILTDAIPTVKEVVSYNRSWPNKAEIEIREHTPGFVIESDGIFFLVDEEGVVVTQVDNPQKLLIARDQLTENFVRGEVLPNNKLAPFIISMSKSWNIKINTSIEYVKFPGKVNNDVQFVTKAGWSVLFDVTRPVSVQLSSLAVILNKQVGPSQINNLAYVDLRLSKWAYYCFKESPCQQKEQPVTAGAVNEQQ